MTTHPQFLRLRYVSPCGLCLVLLCCQEAVFFNYHIVHGLPPPPFSHPDRDFLECWYLRYETATGMSVYA